VLLEGGLKKEVEGDMDILMPASMIRHAELRCGERETYILKIKTG